MVKTLYIVRHGQTFFNFHHKTQGSCDSRLTALGIRQAKAAGDYFKKQNIHFDAAYCSTQERASDTLELITDHKMPYTRLKDFVKKIMVYLKVLTSILCLGMVINWMPLLWNVMIML